MRLFLVRHAPTDETGRTLTGRMPGVALSTSGRSAAHARALEVGRLAVTHLYTSPVERCVETAEILGESWKRAPAQIDGFAEVDYGRWTGRTLNALRKLKAWQRLVETPSRFRFPDGESLRDVQVRSVDAVEDLAGRHRTGHVAVVAHADVIRVILAHYLGMPLDLVHRLDVRPLSVSAIDLDPGGRIRVPIVNAGNAPEEW